MKQATLLLAAAIAAALSAPVLAQTTAAPVAATAAAPAATATQGVNPFLGTPLNFEGAKQELELAKVRSQLLDEQVKQRASEIDLKQLPSKREAELRKTLYGASSMTPPPDLPEIQLDGTVKAPSKKATSKKKAQAKPVDAAPAAPVVPPAPRVEVLGMTDSKEGRSAMISINGSVASVKSGDMTQLGRVQVNDDQVMVGGKNYAMHSATLSRLAVPSTAPAVAGATGSGGAAGGAYPGALGGVTDVLRNAGPATSRGPLPPGLAPITR